MSAMSMMMFLMQIIVASCMTVSSMMLATVSMLIGASIMFGIHLWMMSMTDFLDDSIETVMFVRCVLNDTSGAIRLLQLVSACELIYLIYYFCYHKKAHFARAFFVAVHNLRHLSTITFNEITITRFPLFLVVAGVMIVHTIVEFIFRIILSGRNKKRIQKKIKNI